MRGVVEGIFVAAQSGQPMQAAQEVVGVAGRGLLGDRHCRPADAPPLGANERVPDLSLVEAEVLESLRDEHGIDLTAEESRRNLLTRGVRLNDLVGRRFTLGEMVCEGVEVCQPCAHMQQKVGKPVLRPLVHRGGLRARIVSGGAVRLGDAITLVDAPVPS